MAYFELNGQPTRLICKKLEPYSRSPLPPPFAEGDDLIVAGWKNKKTGQLNAFCANLVRQRQIVNQNPTTIVVIGGLWITAICFYPVVQILRLLCSVPIKMIGPLLAHDSGIVPFGLMMLAGGLTGIAALVVGARLIKARRMVNFVASSPE